MERDKRRTFEEQEKLVAECRASGLSDRAWCLREGIKPGTFYNWVSRLKVRHGAESIPIATPIPERRAEQQDIVRVSLVEEKPVAELPAEADSAQTGTVMEIAVGQIRIRLTNAVSPELLTRMLQILR